MNSRLCTGLAALVSVLFASCYPYTESPPKKKSPVVPATTTTTPEQLKLKAQDELKKKEAEALAKSNTPEPSAPTTNQPSAEKQPKPATEPKRDYAFANKVPGKEGFVFSPYNNKVVDVRDIPSGTLVRDPTYSEAEKKYFRVP